MMIAQGINGRKISGHSSGNYVKKMEGGHTPEGTVGRKTSSVRENDTRVISETRKATAKKPEFGNFADKVNEAFTDKEDVKSIKQSGSKGVQSIQSALLSNPVSRLASDPLKELKDEMKQVKNAAGTIVKAVTSDTVDFTEPNDTPEKRKFEKLQEGLKYIDEGIRKGADRVKKRLKKIFNHPEWYTRYPEFITTNLNYGVRKETQYFPVAIGAQVKYSMVIPQRDGAVAQTYIDQMHGLFQKLRGSNSGAFNYTVEDLAAYIECVRSIYALHSKLVRDIQAINNLDFYINKTPYALMQVLGYNAASTDTIIGTKAQYVARLNQLGEMIFASFPIPPQMAVFDRDHYLAKVLLEDGKGPKSSIYAYVLTNVIEASVSGYVKNTTVSGDFANQLAILGQLINSAHAFLSPTYPNADTFAKIAGDILKAYGQQAFRPCDVADLTSRAATAFDEYLLHQLQNTNAIGVSCAPIEIQAAARPFSVVHKATLAIPGDNAHTIPLKKVRIINVSGADPMLINTNKSDITGAETLSLTRGNYTVVAKASPTVMTYQTNYITTIDTCGTDAVHMITVVYYDKSNNIATTVVHSCGETSFGGGSAELSFWSQIDYMPGILAYNDSSNTGEYSLIQDIDTYAYMTRDQLAQFNDTCVLSLYKTVDISDQVNFRAVKR